MVKPRRVNWDQVAQESGIQTWRSPEGGTSTASGTAFARHALEFLLGSDNIRDAVRLVLEPPSGRQAASSVALSVLRHIRSLEATELAYAAYKNVSGQDAAIAVGLIADIAHPRALDWVEEFLRDADVAPAGVGVLDQLLFTWSVDSEDERVQSALKLALRHKDTHVRERARKVRALVRRR